MDKKVCCVCGRTIEDHMDYHYTDHKGEYVCGSCVINGEWYRCGCGRMYKKDTDDKERCDICEKEIYLKSINNYTLKPRTVFKNAKHPSINKDIGTRYYGLEMEFNNVSPETVYQKGEAVKLYTDRYLYNKSDGSISYGVEVVTAPLDKKSLKSLLIKMDNIFEYVGERSYRENAGLHIHVNNKSIDPIDRYKIRLLLNGNATEKEKKIMYYLSGRINSTEETCDDHYFGVGTFDRIAKEASNSRYKAVNSCNKNTTEFRLFKSSNEPDVILSYVELVDKIIEYCHTHPLTETKISSFITWLQSNTTNKLILSKLNSIKIDATEKKVKRFMIDPAVLDAISKVPNDLFDYFVLFYVVQHYSLEDAVDKVISTGKRSTALTKEFREAAVRLNEFELTTNERKVVNEYKTKEIEKIFRQLDKISRKEMKCV